VDPLSPADPRRIGPYELKGRLGSGGMGSVYLGESRGGRAVAVKVVHRHLLDGDPTFRERFRAEVAAARTVGGFYTAAIVDGDADADPPWYASAYIDAPTLADLVHGSGPLSPSVVAKLGAGLAEALVAIHATRLVHRDLKPQNVLMAADGPRVIDFGIAKVMTDGAGSTRSAIVGTPGYIAPEILSGGAPSTASDVFALGALLVFALTGAPPFPGDAHRANHHVLHQPPVLDGVPPALRPLLARCLDASPPRRPTPAWLLDAFSADGEAWSAPQRVVPAAARVPAPTRPYAPAATVRDDARPDRVPVDAAEPIAGAGDRLVAATPAARAAAAAVVGVPPALLLLWSGAGLLWSAGLAVALTAVAWFVLADDARWIDDGELPEAGPIDVLVPLAAVTAVSLYLSVRDADLPWWGHVVVLTAALAVGALCAGVANTLLQRVGGGPGPREYVRLATPIAPSSAALVVLLLDQGVGPPLWTSVVAGAALGVGTAVLVGRLMRPRLPT
jgi:Protein kinase domain